ncbi:MAG: VanZ family protein [Chloroflexota bacterium]
MADYNPTIAELLFYGITEKTGMEIVIGGLFLPLWPIGVIALDVAVVVRWRQTHHLPRVFCLMIFGLYLLLILDKVFFPIVVSVVPTVRLWELPPSLFINLIPFNFDFSQLPAQMFQQVFLNVLLTVPFGFGISFVTPFSSRRIVWLALALGLSFELGQLVISVLLTYPYRIIDVNDVLLNALGVLIGYGMFRVFAWMYAWVMRRVGIERRGLGGYVYEVASRA